jgi:hypothetical protein
VTGSRVLLATWVRVKQLIELVEQGAERVPVVTISPSGAGITACHQPFPAPTTTAG